MSPWCKTMVAMNNAHYTWKYFMDGVHTDLALTLHDPLKAKYKEAIKSIREKAMQDSAKRPNELIFLVVHTGGMNSNEDNLVIWIGKEEKIEL